MDITETPILIVDDNPTNIKVLFDVLKEAKFRILVAKSGEIALERLQSVTPGLILLDVMMPGIDGFETCCRLKALDVTRDIPVIFMTALSDTENRIKGLSLGAVDYITKPFQQDEVLLRVKTHLQLYLLNKKLEQRVAERTSELTTTLEQLKQSQLQLQSSQLQLVQSEKMSALGNLVAGIAHEINNPTSFIIGNLEPAQQYAQDLFGLLDLYQYHYPDPVEAIQEELEAIDLEYVKQDFPNLLKSLEDGAERIFEISTSLRTFSRADQDKKVPFDLHQGLESTLLILKHRLKANEWRNEIEIVKDYGDLPLVECLPGAMNQVFMNLLANAIDALDETNPARPFPSGTANSQQIQIRTALYDRKSVIIQIRDTGIGMTSELQHCVFDYLFTTKPMGKGTGLGLTIVRQLIEEKHQGKIAVSSEPGKGTEFTILLPIQSESN